MSVNSSSSLPPPDLSPSNTSSHNLFGICFGPTAGNFIFTAFAFTSVLLVIPLAAVILHLGLQRRQQHCSASHCDVITYHMAVMELISLLGSLCYCIGFYTSLLWMMSVASHVFLATFCGQMWFHVLTCVERYLAVVHPVTYLRLRQGSGVRIRNSSIWCVWLLCSAKMNVLALSNIAVILILYLVQQVVSLAVLTFCSLSVLRVLRRPGPGEGSEDRKRADLSKQRAFHTIVAIMGTLLLRFGGTLVCSAIFALSQMSVDDRCSVIESGFWFSLPSSLVLPLLFLHRAGKLQRCNAK